MLTSLTLHTLVARSLLIEDNITSSIVLTAPRDRHCLLILFLLSLLGYLSPSLLLMPRCKLVYLCSLTSTSLVL